MTTPRIILDIDFDYFVREPPILDWGHSEDQEMFTGSLWYIRAQGAIMQGHDLGDILTPPNDPDPHSFEDDLMARGLDKRGCMHIVSDSHVETGRWLYDYLKDYPHPTHVLHFDAHHDLGYGTEPPTDLNRMHCGNWLYHVATLPGVERVDCIYPNWRSEPCPITGWDISERKPECKPDNVHLTPFSEWAGVGTPLDMKRPDVACICRSGAWVPPWLDAQFPDLFHHEMWRAIGEISDGKHGLYLRDMGDGWEDCKQRIDPTGELVKTYNEIKGVHGTIKTAAVPSSQLHSGNKS